jgi:hypothetical protein
MGMFDTFVTNVKCPNCGNILNEWQTKDLECILETFRINGKIHNSVHQRTRNFSILKSIKNPKYKPRKKDIVKTKYVYSSKLLAINPNLNINVHDYCEKCQKLIKGIGIIKNNVFKGVRLK